MFPALIVSPSLQEWLCLVFFQLIYCTNYVMYKNVCHHFVNEMGVVLIKSGYGQQKIFSALTRTLEKNPPFRIPGSAPELGVVKVYSTMTNLITV